MLAHGQSVELGTDDIRRVGGSRSSIFTSLGAARFWWSRVDRATDEAIIYILDGYR